MRRKERQKRQRRENYVRGNGVDEGLFFDSFLFVCVICICTVLVRLRGGLLEAKWKFFGGAFSEHKYRRLLLCSTTSLPSHQILISSRTNPCRQPPKPQFSPKRVEAASGHRSPPLYVLDHPGIYLCCPPTPGWLTYFLTAVSYIYKLLSP